MLKLFFIFNFQLVWFWLCSNAQVHRDFNVNFCGLKIGLNLLSDLDTIYFMIEIFVKWNIEKKLWKLSEKFEILKENRKKWKFIKAKNWNFTQSSEFYMKEKDSKEFEFKSFVRNSTSFVYFFLFSLLYLI